MLVITRCPWTVGFIKYFVLEFMLEKKTPHQILEEAFQEIMKNHGMAIDEVKYSFIEMDDGAFKIIDIDVSGSLIKQQK